MLILIDTEFCFKNPFLWTLINFDVSFMKILSDVGPKFNLLDSFY